MPDRLLTLGAIAAAALAGYAIGYRHGDRAGGLNLLGRSVFGRDWPSIRRRGRG